MVTYKIHIEQNTKVLPYNKQDHTIKVAKKLIVTNLVIKSNRNYCTLNEIGESGKSCDTR